MKAYGVKTGNHRCKGAYWHWLKGYTFHESHKDRMRRYFRRVARAKNKRIVEEGVKTYNDKD